MEKNNKKPDLRDLRLARGWTQQQIADKIGMSRSYCAIIEKGRTPSIAVAQKLAKVFNLDWHMFFENDE